jgi:hypothetical protein
MSARRVFRIDRLVLHGFSPLDAARLRDAFEAALSGPDAGSAEPTAAGSRDSLQLSIRNPGSPEALGRAAARELLKASQR